MLLSKVTFQISMNALFIWQIVVAFDGAISCIRWCIVNKKKWERIQKTWHL